MQVGDFVLVPDGDDIYFCKVTSDYFIDQLLDNNTDGYPHQRKVKWLSDTSRTLAHGEEYISETTQINTMEVTYPLTEI